MDATVLRLDGEMTIQRAAELKPLMLDVLAAPGAAVEVDLSDVTDIDSSGVQLLFMLQDAARAAQCDMRVLRPSAAVQQVFSLLGLRGCFGEAEHRVS